MHITLTQPDDWHLHLRDDDAMASVVAHSAERFGRAIVMPNLKPPVADTEMARAYRERILRALETHSDFQPLMTLYMTDNLSPAEIVSAKESGIVQAVKLYPAGATTNSDSGVTDIKKMYPVLEAMQKHGLPLLVHAEVTDSHVDIFDREKTFIGRHLEPLVKEFPQLRLVFEHITTKEAADFVSASADNVAATITAHHLLFNRNAMLAGGIRPHFYCLPILKRESHQTALISAATSGNPRFFLGTDSAPHSLGAKECACGCAGCYTAHAAIELYTQAFDQAGALDKLEGFASFFGPDFYGLPRNRKQITLKKRPWEVPKHYSFGNDTLIPLCAGEQIDWQIVR
ncbi:MAG: dihydroorotase [endosymbiont of Seepiophila jonesi]|uniref:Dihydroorotase n=1 Tax=endosymbiont of Lamellibrachia luymesi TaxID=2200907 RepID=A0A370E125_9GAMM|nr:MAG: dihydroorotase [endosymbiont of Seepiophila jonesi]RDH93108.1 MAG: dihydroorotase [endosymbiont of Lamellibrachia luymesi]